MLVLKQKVEPKLRFGKGVLSPIKLERLVRFSSGGTPSMENERYWKGNIPWISASSMTDKFIVESERKLTQEGLNSGSKLAQAGSLLLLVRGSMLYNKIPIGIARIDVAFNQDLKALKPIGDVESEFLYQWFSSKENFLLGKVVGTGIGAGKLDSDLLKNLEVYTPPKEEQQKIASFLSAVDEKIKQLKRKKELLEQYKKGVMQQLFSGEFRFKDDTGKEFPKWIQQKLGELGNTFNGLQGKTKENFGSGERYIQYKQIFDDSKIDLAKCGYVKIGKDENQQQVKFGDVFFTTSSETPDEIGFSSVLLNEAENTYLNSFCFGFRPHSLYVLNPHFARYLFRSGVFRKIIQRLAQGSTRYNMSKTEFLKLKISIPSLEEQRKIGEFLSGMDEKINIITKKLLKAKEFKKGLLQEMFV